jgi:hypothetical protein
MSFVQPQNFYNTAGTYPGTYVQNTSTPAVTAQYPAVPTNNSPLQHNVCYAPQYYCTPSPYTAPYPRGSVGAVEININNPSVNSAPTSVTQIPNCVPAPQQAIPAAQSIPLEQPKTPEPPAAAPIPTEPPAAKEIKKEEPKKTEPTTKKDIVPLTNTYIKTLENYLNNPNPDVRILGAKEILNRFKEEPTRRENKALTNLLNKALRDSSPNVRLLSLSVLSADVAEGDKLTYKILQDMQKSDSAYNQDSVTASEIMLKKAGKKLSVESKADSLPLKDNPPQSGQNLDVTAG